MAESVSWVSMMRTLLWSRVRSQLQYRTSLVTDVVSQGVLLVTEFFEVYVMVAAAGSLGGMDMRQAGLVYACAQLGFSVADLVFGMVEDVGEHIRSGTLEGLLVRPTSLLTQLVTSDLQLRRLGRLGTGIVAYPVMLWLNHVHWTPAHLALAVLAPVSGFLVYSSFLLWAGAFVFFVVDGKQAANSITYGGKTSAQSPGAALFTPIRVFFTFVAPALLTSWAPMAVLTGAPLTPEVPSWLAWCGVPAGLVTLAVGLFAWGRGIRHYTGAGG